MTLLRWAGIRLIGKLVASCPGRMALMYHAFARRFNIDRKTLYMLRRGDTYFA